MEQLRAISFCSRPRSYRKRNTSLIFRMDRAFWDIRFLLYPEEKSPLVVQHRFPLLLRKLDPETSISIPVPTRFFHRGSDYSHPRNLYSHARNPYSHPRGIFIHIAPESVFTCPGIRTLLNLNRLDFVNKASTPTRSYPAIQAGEVRLLGSIAQQRQLFLDVVIRKSIECHRQAKLVLKI